jgi:hypothetical protein
MANWTRLPQEEGDQDFWFAGSCFLTRGVSSSLSAEEIQSILTDLNEFVKEKQGIDYLQVYEREDGLRVWVIDQIPRSELCDHPDAHNHFTLLFPEEY